MIKSVMRASQNRAKNDAFKRALSAISPLPSDDQIQVVRGLAAWVSMNATRDVFAESDENQLELRLAGTSCGEFDLSERLPAIFVDHGITTRADQILVTAALLQKEKGNRSLAAREISRVLSEAGIELNNIAAQINGILRRPGHRQMNKAKRKNRQCTYQVTPTGIRAVDALLEGKFLSDSERGSS